jgi:hypothetical protein
VVSNLLVEQIQVVYVASGGIHSLGGTSDHVLDEVTVTRSSNNGAGVDKQKYKANDSG